MGRFTLRPADWLRVAMSGGVCSILSVCAAGVTSGRRGGACVACRLRGPEAAGTLHLIYSSGFSRRSAAPVTSPRLFTARLEGGSAGGPCCGRVTPHPPSALEPPSTPQPRPLPCAHPLPHPALLLNPHPYHMYPPICAPTQQRPSLLPSPCEPHPASSPPLPSPHTSSSAPLPDALPHLLPTYLLFPSFSNPPNGIPAQSPPRTPAQPRPIPS